MPIPDNMEREHIFQAIIKIEKEGILPRRHAIDYAMLYEEKQYPCKLVISWANIYANDEELDSNSNVFNSYMAHEYSLLNYKKMNSQNLKLLRTNVLNEYA